jgi:Dual specificity phosphatase, catalytic domain
MNYSKITNNLYIGTTPKSKDYELLHSLKIDLVINMRIGLPPVHDPLPPPLQSLWLPTIDSPLTPIPIRALLKGATAALKVIDRGGVVYTHCSHGRHRGPVMGACILIAQCMEAEQAMQLVEQQRPQADLHVRYIQQRIIKFAQKWGARS